MFTTYNVYKRARTTEFHSTFERIEEAAYRRGFNVLSVDTRRQFEDQAHNELVHAMFLHDELCNLLKLMRGTVSYKTLTTQMGKIVNEETIQKHVRSLKGFSIRKIKFLPLLTQYGRKALLRWAQNFWIFWESTRLCSGVIFILCHLDEKWFNAVVLRTQNKVVTSIRMKPVVYKVHHNSHIDKHMFIAMTAFIPHNNDIMAGGVSSQIGLYRVVRIAEAKKGSFKRVYKKNGTYMYPRTMSNRLREKGKDYFQLMELTGAVRGTPKDPKISKLDTYLKHFLPAMDEKVREISTKNGFKKVVMVKQEDNEGLNQNKKYVKRLQ